MIPADSEKSIEEQIVGLVRRFAEQQHHAGDTTELNLDQGDAARAVAAEIMGLVQPEVSAEQLYTVAVRSTHKSNGVTHYSLPGCTPEIGSLADAQELLDWVKEGVPNAADSPYEEHVAIYRLTETRP